MSAQSYLSRGVSPTKDDVKKAVASQSKGLFPGSFCKIIADMAGDEDYCTAIHADGAGTKSSVAYLMYKETGDLSWFSGIAQDSVVMNTDDLLCIGANNDLFLSNTIGRNAHRIDGRCIAAIIDGYNDFISKLEALGTSVIMTGGETADVGDLVRTVIVDSTVVARMKRSDVINAANIRAGDVIVGLSSSGKATYETKENSGIGSNGLTAARHMLLDKSYLELYPESVSETISKDKIYCGRHKLSDPLPESKLTVGEAILSPTRTYLPVVNKIFKSIGRENIHGLIHCTGGGQVKCRDFGHHLYYVKDNLFPRPAIFKAIFKSGEVLQNEMYQIFNMGHRLELYCDSEFAEKIIDIAESFNVEARIIGHVDKQEQKENRVMILDQGMEYIYE
ncbi:MAG: AIR synthase related protein [Saccharofermentanales bacterium]